MYGTNRFVIEPAKNSLRGKFEPFLPQNQLDQPVPLIPTVPITWVQSSLQFLD
jgi:hypothetical protein